MPTGSNDAQFFIAPTTAAQAGARAKPKAAKKAAKKAPAKPPGRKQRATPKKGTRRRAPPK
jgi:hypothetical protein